MVVILFIALTVILALVQSLWQQYKKEGKDMPKKKIVQGVVVITVIVIIAWAFISSGSGGGREMGRCWICGKSGSFQLDGSYYCFDHYNARLFGSIG